MSGLPPIPSPQMAPAMQALPPVPSPYQQSAIVQSLPPIPQAAPGGYGPTTREAAEAFPQKLMGLLGMLIGAPSPEESANLSALYQKVRETPASEGIFPQSMREFGREALPYMMSAATFGGVNAKNAPLDDLAKAEAMEKAGGAVDDIWRATGWGRGADGQWRFEIDDAESFLETAGVNAPSGHLRLQHDDVQTQYPEMWNTLQQSIRRTEGGVGPIGQYDPSFNTLIVRGKSGHKSTALHELQHGLQERENFARGGAPSMFGDPQDIADAQVLRTIMTREGIDVPSQAAKRFEEMTGRPPSLAGKDIAFSSQDPFTLPSPRDQYKRLAGEVEARNVQNRMDMNSAERREVPPWSTEDVPRDQQIIRGLLGK